jgi:hypothetical protein
MARLGYSGDVRRFRHRNRGAEPESVIGQAKLILGGGIVLREGGKIVSHHGKA